MMLIEAMKLQKDLAVKAADIRKKITQYCANYDFETEPYGPTQKEQIAQWVQAHRDLVAEILKLRVSIQYTNLMTWVTMQIGNVSVSHTIAGWIHRRRELAEMDALGIKALNDRELREGTSLPATQPGSDPKLVKIRRYYDLSERDRLIEEFRSEPGIIDRTLEVINATTTLIDANP